jgi:hypothetical protein
MNTMRANAFHILSAVVLALVALILLSGCVKGPTFTYEMSISDPYNLSSGIIEMRLNTTANVVINNSGGGEIDFNLLNASLTANFEDGSTQVITGQGKGGIVPADGSYKMELSFYDVPLKYVLLDNPPRFHTLITSYDVNVTIKGRQMLFVVWSPEEVSKKDMRIPMSDMPIGNYLRGLKDSLKLNSES